MEENKCRDCDNCQLALEIDELRRRLERLEAIQAQAEDASYAGM